MIAAVAGQLAVLEDQATGLAGGKDATGDRKARAGRRHVEVVENPHEGTVQAAGVGDAGCRHRIGHAIVADRDVVKVERHAAADLQAGTARDEREVAVDEPVAQGQCRDGNRARRRGPEVEHAVDRSTVDDARLCPCADQAQVVGDVEIAARRGILRLAHDREQVVS